MKSMTRMFLTSVAIVGMMGLATSAQASGSGGGSGSGTVRVAQEGGSSYVFHNEEPGNTETITNRAGTTGTGGAVEHKMKKHHHKKGSSSAGSGTGGYTNDRVYGSPPEQSGTVPAGSEPYNVPSSGGP